MRRLPIVFLLAAGCLGSTPTSKLESDEAPKRDANDPGTPPSQDLAIGSDLPSGVNDPSGPSNDLAQAAGDMAIVSNLVSSISKDGVTWTFAHPVQAGQFITGDWWVVGPVTISAIDPPPQTAAPYMNGSVKNMPFARGSGFDQRLNDGVDQSWWFDATLREYPPIALGSGDTLVSSISYATPHTVAEQFSPWDQHPSPIRSYSVLTVVPAPVSSDAFRPSYCDRGRTYHYGAELDRGMLPSLAPPSTPPPIADFEAEFRRPWIDTAQFNWDVAGDYTPGYGHHLALAVSHAALLLTVNFPPAQKVNLTNYLVQYGIDMFGCVRAGLASHVAYGGHGNGRKLPVIFAGVMLNDAAMKNVSTTYPDRFSEDMQSVYVNRIPGGFTQAWEGAKVIYGGHLGVHANGTPVDTTSFMGAAQPYEQLQPSAWPVQIIDYGTHTVNEQLGEAYRRCCTSTALVMEALAMRLLGPAMVSAWNYPALFDYADRWMTEDDSQAVTTIKSQTGFDYGVGDPTNYQRQGQTRYFLEGRISQSSFVDDMWKAYRASH